MALNSWTMVYDNPQPFLPNLNQNFLDQINNSVNSKDPPTIQSGLEALSDRLCFGWTLPKCVQANLLPRLCQFIKQPVHQNMKNMSMLCFLRIAEVADYGARLLVYSGILNDILRQFHGLNVEVLEHKVCAETAVMIVGECLAVDEMPQSMRDYAVKFVCQYFRRTLDYKLVERFVPRFHSLGRMNLNDSHKQSFIKMCLKLITVATKKDKNNGSGSSGENLSVINLLLPPVSSLLFLLNAIVEKSSQPSRIRQLPKLVSSLIRVAPIKALHNQLAILLRSMTIFGFDPEQPSFLNAFDSSRVIDVVCGILESSECFAIWDNIYIYLRQLMSSRAVVNVIAGHSRLMLNIGRIARLCFTEYLRSDTQLFLFLRFSDLMVNILNKVRQTVLVQNSTNFKDWLGQLANRLTCSQATETQIMGVLESIEKYLTVKDVEPAEELDLLRVQRIITHLKRVGTLNQRLRCREILRLIEPEDEIQQQDEQAEQYDDTDQQSQKNSSESIQQH